MFWWKRLMEDNYFRDLTKTRWHQLRQADWSNEQLEFAIESIVGYIYQAQQRNYERWPILGQYVWPNYNWQGNTYDDEVEFFENWLFDRLEWMDDHFEGNLLVPEAELSGESPVLTIGLTDDYFSREVIKNKYVTLNNIPDGITLDTVIYAHASEATLYLEGPVPNPTDISVTLDTKILNSFSGLTSSELSIGVGIPGLEPAWVDMVYADQALHVNCETPEILGEYLRIFNTSGQWVARYRLERIPQNRFKINLDPGIYICTLNYREGILTRKIVILE